MTKSQPGAEAIAVQTLPWPRKKGSHHSGETLRPGLTLLNYA